MPIQTSKVWKKGPFIFGSSGSYRAIQLVRQYMNVMRLLIENRRRADPITESFMVSTMVPAIKKILEDHNFSEKHNEQSSQEAEFLIGVDNKLFLLQSDYAVLEFAAPFAAIGSGMLVAAGAMEILTKNTRMNPATIIKHALTAVHKHVNTVGEPGPIITTLHD